MSIQPYFFNDNDSLFAKEFQNLWPTRLLDHFFSFPHRNLSNINVDMYETDKNIVVKAQVPGINKEQIHINMQNNYLNIEIENSEQKEEKNESKTYYYQERSYGKIQRTLKLPHSIDIAEQPVANINNGILEIVFAKKPGYVNGVRQIQIS